MAAAPTPQPQSREAPWSLESEPPALRITAALPPGPSMAVPTPGPGEAHHHTPRWSMDSNPRGSWRHVAGPGLQGSCPRPQGSGWRGPSPPLRLQGTMRRLTTTSTVITTTVTTVQPPGQLLVGSGSPSRDGDGEAGGLPDSSLCVSVLACSCPLAPAQTTGKMWISPMIPGSKS